MVDDNKKSKRTRIIVSICLQLTGRYVVSMFY